MNHDDASEAALSAQIAISFSGIRAAQSLQVLRASCDPWPTPGFEKSLTLVRAQKENMAYELHIERDPPIDLKEWEAVVGASLQLCLDEGAATTSNPATGEQIAIQGLGGTAAMVIEGQWIRVFNWRRGKVSFTAPPVTSTRDPVMAQALKVAVMLSAIIRGDEGETYDGTR
jgi:hypothetical protein